MPQQRALETVVGRSLALLAVAIAVAVVAAAAAGLIVRWTMLPPDVVWTIRRPDARSDESLTVHDAPGGAALLGRWILVEGDDATLGPGVVLVRLPLRDGEAADALERQFAGGELVYRSSGTIEPRPGAIWHLWTRE